MTDSVATAIDSLQTIIRNYNAEDKLVERAVWFALIPFVVAFVFLVFIIYRSRREALFRQKEAELNRQISEVEMKALRSQLNPHFIFNCLNSIHQFVHSNDNLSAGNYLVKFSKLMRLVLENSVYHEVSLKDDLDALKMYIDMEQMRMKNNFEYEIVVARDVNTETVLVPPLILQPFVENSIWHGLNAKKLNGKLVIRISRSDGMLQYIVEDNGSNVIKEETRPQGKKKSLGMSLTRERLEVLNKTKGSNASFTVSDLKNADGDYAGKKVVLNLPFDEESV
jgi:LytS/YehU family sensor histidine kinase